jgi:formylglycine-generating enzyme required for sulfatase activity
MPTLLLLALAAPQVTPAPASTADRGMAVAEQSPGQLTGTSYGHRHALVVGIDDYAGTGFPSLEYAVADARAVARILVERYGFEQQNVKLLLDDGATKNALEDALEDWACDVDRVSEEDLFVLFFAGHGETRSAGRRGSRGYLVPADGQRGEWSTLLGMDDFEGVSELIPAKHALFVLDCCFGGLALTRSAPPVAAGLTNRARQVISAGTAEQTVQDAGGGGHSVFTGALLGGLEGHADLDGDGVVTFGELFNHIGREVERKTEQRQTPLQAAFPDHEGGNVALFAPGLKPGLMTAAERLRQLERSEKERLAELERLADYIVVEGLVSEAAELWPPHPSMIPRYRSWLARARELVDRRRQHEASVRQVRQEAYLSQVAAGRREEGQGAEPTWDEVDARLRWRHETFVELIARLDALDAGLLAAGTTSEEHGWSVPMRLDFAMQLEEGFAPGGAHARRWEDALPALRAAYPELDLEPQMGLVPIDPDPESGLWEFAHLLSGTPATRVDGELVRTDETGLVFVLLPGREATIGAQSSNAAAPCFDPVAVTAEAKAVRRIRPAPFFISKFEMTQGQWARFTGQEPRMEGPRSHDRPVTHVSWWDCDTVTRRLGLELPDEERWEYAARAGTTTCWWPGDGIDSLRGAGNFLSRDALDVLPTGGALGDPIDWDDGAVALAPVGTYPANPFGLHDVLGNVSEWCAQLPEEAASPRRTRTRELRSVRGGNWRCDPSVARSAFRYFRNVPDYVSPAGGLRPARSLAPRAPR